MIGMPTIRSAWVVGTSSLFFLWLLPTSSDPPEVGPGVLGPSGVSTTAGATGTATQLSGSSSNGGSLSSMAGAIAGVVVGGIIAVIPTSIAGVAVVFDLRMWRPRTPFTPLTAQPQMDQVQQPPPPSENGTFGPSSAPATPIFPKRFHVRVFVPPLRFCALMHFFPARQGPN